MFYYQACVTLTLEMLFGLQTGVTHQLFVTCAIFEGPHLQAQRQAVQGHRWRQRWRFER